MGNVDELMQNYRPEPRASLAYITNPSTGLILCTWNRKYGCWGLPGGKAEPGESDYDALARELLEETGLQVATFGELYKAQSTSSASGRIVTVFEVVPDRFPKCPYQVEEGSPVDWYPRELLLEQSSKNAFYSFYTGFFSTIDDWSSGLV